MRRFLLKVIAFALSFAVLVGGLEASASRWLSSPTQAKMDALKYRDIFDAERDEEAIVIGTSHAVYGVAPEPLAKAGLPAYNFGFRNSTPRFYRLWYDVYKAHQGAPEAVIFCVDWFAFSDHTNRNFESDSRYFPDEVFWGMLRDRRYRTHTLIANRFTLYADRTRVKGALMGNLYDFHDLNRFDHGYIPYLTDIGSHQMPRWGDGNRVEAYKADFEATLDAMARDGARVALVQIPEYLPVAGEHPRQNAEIAEIAARRSLPFLDYNGPRRSALNADKSKFYDWAHLNDVGCQAFSAVLARDLGALPGFGRKAPPRPPAR